MEITGTIFQVLPAQTGTGSTGKVWKKQGFVLLTGGSQPHYFYFEVFDGDDHRLLRYGIHQNGMYSVAFDIFAHEWQGRWYNAVHVYDVREVRADAAQNQQGDAERHGGAAVVQQRHTERGAAGTERA